MVFNLNVVHIAVTPLAGAPIRLVNALNKYTDIKARFINLNPNAYGTRTFPEDLVWERDRGECISCLEKADIVHFHHHNFDVETTKNPFGINFREITDPECKYIFQYHSAPRRLRVIRDRKKASLVIPHYPERYFPYARVVPNIIDLPLSDQTNEVDILFSPSLFKERVWDHRWSTKSAPEVIEILNQLKKKMPYVRISVFSDTPYQTVIEGKEKSLIIIDDVNTGSFHQSALEGIALGKAVVCYIDDREKYILSQLTNSSDIPFVNCRLENLEKSLSSLLQTGEDEVKKIGKKSREWYDAHYTPEKMIKYYTESYQELMLGEQEFLERSIVLRKSDFTFKKKIQTILLPDVIWAARILILYIGYITGCVLNALSLDFRPLRNKE